MTHTHFGWIQLLDSALPIGGFAHSFGLETAVERGSVRTPTDLSMYLRAQLQHSWGPLDAAVLRLQREALDVSDADEFIKWDRRLHAQRVGRETREGQRKMGRQLMQLAARWDDDVAIPELQSLLRAREGFGMLPTVYAWMTHRWNIPLEECIHGYFYNAASMTIQAAIRLISMGQAEGQTMLYKLQPLMSETVHTICDPAQAPFPGSYAWLQDIDTMAHEGLYSRLFMS